MEIILTIIILATITQYIVDRLKDVIQRDKLKNYKIAPALALIVGQVIAFGTQINFLTSLNIESHEIVGIIVTGLVISGGAEAVHELIAKVRDSR